MDCLYLYYVLDCLHIVFFIAWICIGVHFPLNGAHSREDYCLRKKEIEFQPIVIFYPVHSIVWRS